MPWGVAAAAVIGGIAQDRAADKAADAQRDATTQSNDLQWRMFDQQRQDQSDWMSAGRGSLAQLVAGTGAGGEFNRDFSRDDFEADPGYEFRRSEGLRGIESRAAARGTLSSGSTLRDLTQYGSGLAAQEYGAAYDRFNNNRTQRFNRLASIAGVGQTATNNVGAAGQRTAETVGANLTNMGNAQGASDIARGNALSGAANTLGNFALGKYYQDQYSDANRKRNGSGGGGYWESGGDGAEPVYVPVD